MEDQTSEVEDLERVIEDGSAEPIKISYTAIKHITKNFAQVIGDGGFGVVYLGGLRNGMVAVKKLFMSKDFSDQQFLDEVTCLKKVKHKNIVRFLGYCADTQGEVMDVEGKLRIVEVQQRVLCFEYVPNGSLHHFLKEKNHGYEWNIRYQIIKGICQGLHYLHQERINHLDLKPANVLLGALMEPKITDFGVSRCIDGEQSTIVTKNFFGTLGYIAPEFIDKQQISLKSDIFSIGVIMINLLMERNGSIIENWHQTLDADCPQMNRCIEIAQLCVDKNPDRRPTIGEIIHKLIESEKMIQMVPPSINEPRNDPGSSLYQVVQTFHKLSSQTLREYSRMDDIYMELNVLECILEGRRKPSNLSYQLLQFITEKFSDGRIIGDNGQGTIYKGILQSVAVKRLSRGLHIDDRKFHQEVLITLIAKHKNIVRFLGYCSYTEEKPFEIEGKSVVAEIRERLLCFEYSTNGCLDSYLSDASCGLEWRKRYQIIKGICEGLHYLHGKYIVHLDLKPANILLDDNMAPKISNFGQSRCFDKNQSRAITSKMVGPMGYMAPELDTGLVTFKSDIYSLGVIITKIMTGTNGYPSSVKNILESWEGRLETSSTDMLLKQVRACTEISIACQDPNPGKRPDTGRILEMLAETESTDKFIKTHIRPRSKTQNKAQKAWNELQQGINKLPGDKILEAIAASDSARASETNNSSSQRSSNTKWEDQERTVRKLPLCKALTIPERTTVFEACRLMASRHVDVVLLADTNGVLSGIVTDKDVATRVIAEGLPIDQTILSKIMTRNPSYVTSDTLVDDALQKMVQGKFRHLPVVENGEVIAMLDITRCLYYAIARLEKAVEQQIALAVAVERAAQQLGDDFSVSHTLIKTIREQTFKPSMSAIITESTIVATVSPSDPVYVATQKMRELQVNSVVVTAGNSLHGIFTSWDLLTRVVANNLSPELTPVEKVMTAHPDFAELDTDILQALNNMHEGKFFHIPVLDGDGCITACFDVLQILRAVISMIEGGPRTGSDVMDTTKKNDDEDVLWNEEAKGIDMGLSNIIVVNNLPVVPPEKFEKLENVIHKIYRQIGVIKENGLRMPVNPETKKTYGYCFIEYNTRQEAELAREETNGYKLDKYHIFTVNMFDDFDKYKKVSDTLTPAEIKPYAPRENLLKWLTVDMARHYAKKGQYQRDVLQAVD